MKLVLEDNWVSLSLQDPLPGDTYNPAHSQEYPDVRGPMVYVFEGLPNLFREGSGSALEDDQEG